MCVAKKRGNIGRRWEARVWKKKKKKKRENEEA